MTSHTTKHRACESVSKESPDPKNSITPPGSEVPGSVTGMCEFT